MGFWRAIGFTLSGVEFSMGTEELTTTTVHTSEVWSSVVVAKSQHYQKSLQKMKRRMEMRRGRGSRRKMGSEEDENKCVDVCRSSP